MRDCKKFCRPNLVKYPKDGDIIIRLQNGQTGIVNAKEYERIKKYFKKISDYDSSSNDEQNEGGGGAEPAPTPSIPVYNITGWHEGTMDDNIYGKYVPIGDYDGHNGVFLIAYNNGVEGSGYFDCAYIRKDTESAAPRVFYDGSDWPSIQQDIAINMPSCVDIAYYINLGDGDPKQFMQDILENATGL